MQCDVTPYNAPSHRTVLPLQAVRSGRWELRDSEDWTQMVLDHKTLSTAFLLLYTSPPAYDHTIHSNQGGGEAAPWQPAALCRPKRIWKYICLSISLLIHVLYMLILIAHVPDSSFFLLCSFFHCSALCTWLFMYILMHVLYMYVLL